MLGFISLCQQRLIYTYHLYFQKFRSVGQFFWNDHLLAKHILCAHKISVARFSSHHSLTFFLRWYKSREMIINNLGIFAFCFITFSTAAEFDDFYWFLTSGPATPPANRCCFAQRPCKFQHLQTIEKSTKIHEPRWYLLARETRRIKVDDEYWLI